MSESVNRTRKYNLRSSGATTEQSVKMSGNEIKEIHSLILSLKNELREDIKKLHEDVTDIKNQTANITAEFDDLKKDISEIKNENEELKAENEKLKTSMNLMKYELGAQSTRITQQENYSRRDNLIFDNVKLEKAENCLGKIIDILDKQMNIDNAADIKIDSCHQLPGKDPKPIICSFNWYQDRQRVWNSRQKLKNSSIGVREDFCPDTMKARGILYPIMKLARSQNCYAALNVDKLIINDRTYTINTLDQLPANLDTASLGTKKYGTVTAFFTRNSPLSNFYPCDISVFGQSYHSLEQCFQHQKALHMQKPREAMRIMHAKLPSECKWIGDNIKVTDDNWVAASKDIMYKASKAKFNQNLRVRNFLTSTGDSVLAEASRDVFWGTGLKLDDPTNGERDKWQGNNWLGTTLMRVRQDITDGLV